MRLITAKEVARSVRSLLCFLQAFKGRRVVIEMRNDTFITVSLVDSGQFLCLIFVANLGRPREHRRLDECRAEQCLHLVDL